MTMAADCVECLVVGSGVVGLAVARALACSGREVVLVEANGRIGEEASSRSNEVVHAGFLYPPGSLKERLCLHGRELLLDYCAQRGVGQRRTGKLLPATDDAELKILHGLLARANALGLEGVRLLDAREVGALEPAIQCHAALHSPDARIVDSHALMLALLSDAQAAGALLVTHSRAARVDVCGDGRFEVEIVTGGEGASVLECERLVNAAGLGALPLARSMPDAVAALLPDVRMAHGSFYTYQGRAPFRHLVMPVGATLRGGGAFTLDLAGQGRFGPMLRWVDERDYRVAPDAGAQFAATIRRYWLAVDESRLAPAYAGIQPRVGGPGQAPGDWVVQGPGQHGIRGLVNLFAIDTPGLTACLATAEHVMGLLESPAPPHASRIERSLHAH